MEYFTITEYSQDTGVGRSTAERIIAAALESGEMVQGPSKVVNHKITMTFAHVEIKRPAFEIPAPSFWNDPFNKLGRATA